MAKTPSEPEGSAHRFYALTDRFQRQLGALEDSVSPVDVEVTFSPGQSGDIEALAFLVLMEAARSAQEDLRAIMETAKEINNAKEGWRRPELDFEATFQLMATLYAKHLDAELEDIRCDRDEVGELGELESLRLQMAMDRMSKMMSTLSNLLKKCAEASSQIVRNIR